MKLLLVLSLASIHVIFIYNAHVKVEGIKDFVLLKDLFFIISQIYAMGQKEILSQEA